MNAITHLLHDAFEPPPVTERYGEPKPLPPGSICAISGEPISEGFRSESLLTRASSAPHEIFPVYTSDYVSVEAARCYKHFRGGLTGNLLAVERPDGSVEGHRPMVSLDSANSQGRSNWQRILYGLDPHATLEEGGRCLAIFTEEFQRRLWLDARLSTVGPYWQPYLYSGSLQRTLTVDLIELQHILALCEYVYSLGFTKDHLLHGLLNSRSMAAVREHGFPRIRQLDAILDDYRESDELLLAVFVAQRTDSLDPRTNAGLMAPETYRCLIPTPKPQTTSDSSKNPKASSAPRRRPRGTMQRQLFD
ncbi:MAG: hypothetical protein GVY18_05130 [Bacteroidetes bacterium]|jgi:hypothetical protein|nr:hypothetical protein [Bacteroidota bacterium]